MADTTRIVMRVVNIERLTDTNGERVTATDEAAGSWGTVEEITFITGPGTYKISDLVGFDMEIRNALRDEAVPPQRRISDRPQA